jgi:hypothetical protein
MSAAALLFLGMLALPAGAVENRGTRIAMAVALLDVTEDYCQGRFTVDAEVKTTLMLHFHEYDIAGLASMLSRPLNAFYEDFLHEAKQGRDAFCEKAPEEASRTGYPVILSGDP